MVRIISEVAKYLIIFFMVLYTVLKPCSPAKKRRALNVQIFYVFIIHFLCYLTLYLNYKKKEIAIFYVAQMIVAIVYMVSYHGIYKNSSRLITNVRIYWWLQQIRVSFAHTPEPSSSLPSPFCTFLSKLSIRPCYTSLFDLKAARNVQSNIFLFHKRSCKFRELQL